jgi:hypothetical protein
VRAIIGDRPKIASRTPRTDPLRSNYLCQPVTLDRGHNTRHLLNAEKHSNSQCRRLGLDALLCTYSSRMAYSGHHELPEKQGTNKDSKTPRRASAIYERVPFLVQGYCCPTAAKSSIILLGAVIFLLLLQVKRRADERTRTADLLITSDRSCVTGVCSGLQMPHIYAAFSSPACPVLHRIALPVVSTSASHPPSSNPAWVDAPSLSGPSQVGTAS